MFFLLPTVGSLVDNRAYFTLYPGGTSNLEQTPAPLAAYSSRTVYLFDSPECRYSVDAALKLHHSELAPTGLMFVNENMLWKKYIFLFSFSLSFFHTSPLCFSLSIFFIFSCFFFPYVLFLFCHLFYLSGFKDDLISVPVLD